MISKYGCIAKIGFDIANSISDVNAEFIENAPLLDGQFLLEEWGGCNQAYNLKNNLIGVIGHKAWGEMIDGVHMLHYYSIAFALDPFSRDYTPLKTICTRNAFPESETKNERTRDVTFTSGIVRLENGICELYTGLSDCEVGKIIIDDPFLELENL